MRFFRFSQGLEMCFGGHPWSPWANRRSGPDTSESQRFVVGIVVVKKSAISCRPFRRVLQKLDTFLNYWLSSLFRMKLLSELFFRLYL